MTPGGRHSLAAILLLLRSTVVASKCYCCFEVLLLLRSTVVASKYCCCFKVLLLLRRAIVLTIASKMTHKTYLDENLCQS